jgi:hypothetical protein
VGTFCTGCHSPIGTILGEDGTTQASQRSEVSLDGVSCEVCHSAVNHSNPVGNLSLYFSTTGEKFGPFGSLSTEGHENVQSDFISTPDLCGSCHDVFNFPGLRIEEAFTEYSISPAADQAVRCQDCHMSETPGVVSDRMVGPIAIVEGKTYPDRSMSNHRFVGPDYSLLDTFPYPDDLEASARAQQDMIEQIQQLLENSVQIADVRIEKGAEKATLEVDLESLTTGHNVPTGFTSERQLWLEIAVATEAGELFFQSGVLDSNGDLMNEHSWDVAAGLENLDTKLVNLQSINAQRIMDCDGTVVAGGGCGVRDMVFPFDADFIDKRSLRPLEIRTVTYEFEKREGLYDIEVSLKYRNLPPYLLRALQLDELVPRLEVFTVDQVILRR